MCPSLIKTEPRTQQPDLMHDLRQDREMVGFNQHISKVFESSQELQGFVQADSHCIGWILRPGAAHCCSSN
jgi:hypothetical protein